MPGQLGRLKSRKKKTSCKIKTPRTASATGIRPAKRPKVSSESRKAGARQGGGSSISCECQQSAGRRRCSASPEAEGREGKENEDWDACGVNRSLDRQQLASPECEDSGGPVFPDDDSNQILPVEHFFGNMDIVQDFPQREPKTSRDTQRQSRRRHFYAREDSDDDKDN
ncbi:UPF0688 protein C1orf174 homolog isoform X2 [Takifugu flavidus]|uniref:Uncharacterized protein n=2 Tax=Takifugu flavidus TaxID=433684 RepID=A0A5C6MQ12_9TELE|nr:UPF0688 protein C1orf174 homolog isoform X2 [Takifugu flavidus]XP_056895850.1 UPF0688 protein C1orf174 homolog isoform X2 [Takifugu flavidus]TWW56241.1 hypothetical protein D4764_08G0002280 [Takifugu flavidus]